MKNIQYIGNKPQKQDNVAGSGTIWTGNGDIQPVTDAVAAKLLEHPGVWKLVGDSEEKPESVETTESPAEVLAVKTEHNEMSEADAKPPMANLENMDKVALRDFAQRHFGHQFHHNAGEEKMRQTIVGMMNRG